MNWFQENPLLVISLAVIAFGIWWAMPTGSQRAWKPGILLALAGLLALGLSFERPSGDAVQQVLFWMFGGLAVASGVMMITSRNPVYGALWFALATLGTCGLFLLQSAPFLAAATIIVYAGAIIVTFLFVMMLAQQQGRSMYDQRSRQPLLATLLSFVLLGAVLVTLHGWMKTPPQAGPVIGNIFSHVPADQPLGTMHGLGRSLFGDYLFAVEVAGTVLLVASIGAIAIAPKRGRGTTL